MNNSPAPIGPGQPGFSIRGVYTMIDGDFKEIKAQINKKSLQNARQAAIWLWRAVKKRIRRSSSDKQVIAKPQKIWFPRHGKTRGFEVDKSPVDWMQGKRSVAPDSGRGGRKRADVKDDWPYRWNKASKPGTGPMSHPANRPGWQDEWLRNSILFYENDGQILIYCNPAPPGKRESKSPFAATRLLPNDLEYGAGQALWRRKIHVGYTVEKIRTGTSAKRGGGQYIAGKKQNDGEKIWDEKLRRKGGGWGRYVNKNALKNKSGKTRKSHERKFKETRITLRNEYDWIGGQYTMEPRPFMRPVQAAFFRDYFPQLYNDLLGK